MNFLDHIEINPTVHMTKGEVYPFVDMASVSTKNRIPDHIDRKGFSSGVKFQKGDTVIARIEPCLQNGKKFYCKEIEVGFGSTEFLVFRPKDKEVDSLYLYYFMQQNFIRQNMINSMTGSTGRQRVNNDIFQDLEISIPSIDVQRHIGSVLSSYDDLIENNNRQIALLEELAIGLYKEWFCSYRFPDWEKTSFIDGLPAGWEKCRLEQVIEFNPKLTLSKERDKESVPMAALSVNSMLLDNREFTKTKSNAGSKFQNEDTLLARITPCLENGKTGYVMGIDSDEGAVGSTEFIVMRGKKINSYMVYLLARTNEFREMAIKTMTGSDGRQRAQVELIKDFEYILPSEEVIIRFGEIMKPIFESIHSKSSHSIKLAESRDRLLSRLISPNTCV